MWWPQEREQDGATSSRVCFSKREQLLLACSKKKRGAIRDKWGKELKRSRPNDDGCG